MIPWRTLLLVLLLAACGEGSVATKYTPTNQIAPSGQILRLNFDDAAPGTTPDGAVVYSGAWAVRAEADAPSPPNALCQTGTATFPALRLGDTVYRDVTLTARFKSVSGKDDRAAGLIFRVQDKDNYYILRANALENNVNFYKYAGGKRSDLKGGTATITTGQWQELRVEVSGNRFRGFLNGQIVVEATDDTYSAGQVGLWTKADSVTCFDDLTIETTVP